MKNELALTLIICSALVNWVGKQVAFADETLGVADENRTSAVDSLRFTVGVRAIFQDSGGDYWFGSHGEGLCRYDGEVFEYFTTQDGLADDQILTIQEDAKGTRAGTIKAPRHRPSMPTTA